MIYDRMDKLDSYRGISEHLDAAIDYLAEADLGSLPDGKHPIQGSSLSVTLQSYKTKEAGLGKFEAHKKYMDIQLVLKGSETCYWSATEFLSPLVPYSEERDIVFFADGDAPSIALPLEPGYFAILLPQDAHKPCCHLEGERDVRKVVVKVPL